MEAIKREIRTMLERRQLRARVEDKTNAKGETVIGVILDKYQPTLEALATSLPAPTSDEASKPQDDPSGVK